MNITYSSAASIRILRVCRYSTTTSCFWTNWLRKRSRTEWKERNKRGSERRRSRCIENKWDLLMDMVVMKQDKIRTKKTRKIREITNRAIRTVLTTR